MTGFFAGAGGTSQGAAVVPGLRQLLAANHSRVAMSTHAANFPEVEHDVADLSQVTPRRYPRTEILWASPECTWQTGAAGRPRDDRLQPALFDTHLDDTAAARRDGATQEVAERSRPTMFDVLRFAEHHRYDAILVENVVEAATLWLLWRSWLLGLHDLGYETRVVCANSMHFPGVRAGRAPQSRDRLYVVAWRRGAPAPRLELRPPAWCEPCVAKVAAVQAWKRPDRARLGRYRQQYVYRCPHAACRHSIVEPYVVAGAAAIDWSLSGVRIVEQRPRFVPNTMRRIELGCDRIEDRSSRSCAAAARPRGPFVSRWPRSPPPATTTVWSSPIRVAGWLSAGRGCWFPLSCRPGWGSGLATPCWAPTSSGSSRSETRSPRVRRSSCSARSSKHSPPVSSAPPRSRDPEIRPRVTPHGVVLIVGDLAYGQYSRNGE
jgi:DNA (cytosine-5)-methyltransferase 1